MSYREEMKPYIDEFGLVHPWTDRKGLNGLLYHGYHVGMLNALGLLEKSDRDVFERTFYVCRGHTGILEREPGCRNQEGPDDHVGVTCASQILGMNYAPELILTAGRRMFLELGPIKLPYFYNTEVPGTQINREGKINWAACFLRFPTLIMLMKWGSGYKRSLFSRTVFVLETLYTASFGDITHQDPFMMMWLKLEAFGSEWLKKLVKRILVKRKLTIKMAFESYFGVNHPIAKYCKD